jgi:uncharacterized phage infection (PIP) family protein YhgE
MKQILTLILSLIAVACSNDGGDTLPPRAIIVPLTDSGKAVSRDADAVRKAGNKTRDAVRDTAAAASGSKEAGEIARAENEKLTTTGREMLAQIERLTGMAAGYAELDAELRGLKEITLRDAAQREAATKALVFWQGKAELADEQARIALETVDAQAGTIDSLMTTVALLTTQIAGQAEQIEANAKTDEYVRRVAAENKAATAKLIIAEDKLDWWRWRFAPVNIGLLALLLIWIFRRYIMLLIGVPMIPKSLLKR